MKPFDLSRYMYDVSQAAGAGLMGYNAGNTYAAGTIGAAVKANSFTTANTVPKGSAAGLVASSITDNGTTVAIGRTVNLTGDLNATGNVVLGPLIYTGVGVSTGDVSLELGQYRSGDGVSYIDFHTSSTTDYEARIHRGPGASSNFIIQNKGAASLILNSESTGGNVVIQTLGQNRLGIWDTGDAQFYNNVAVAGSVTATGELFTSWRTRSPQYLLVPNGGGTNGFSGGNGDNASYTTNNMYLDCWYGCGIRTFDGSITGYIDARNGVIDMKNGFRQNGTPMQTALGFTPVRQGGGAYQLTNTVFIGWATTHLRAQVDSSDLGRIVFDGAGFPFSAGGEIKSAGGSAMLQWDMRDNLGIQNGWYGTGGYNRMWRSDYGDIFQFHNTAFRHNYDVGADCGGPGFRWATVWCQSSTMTTSDLREKDWRGGLNEAELKVAKELAKEIGIYRWLSEVEKEGDEAKLNCGFAAQRVIALFERNGLNALDYAFIRHDEWEETTSNGPAEQDEEGNWVLGEPVVHPAGDRYSVMLADLIAFMCVGQEQRLAALEAAA